METTPGGETVISRYFLVTFPHGLQEGDYASLLWSSPDGFLLECDYPPLLPES